MIETQALSVRLGDRLAINALSMGVARGRVTVILGANGAGKTSLVRMLAGLLKPDHGHISIDGTSLAAMSDSERARKIGYLPQNGTPAWAITVRDLVALGRLPYRSRFAGPSRAGADAINRAMQDTDIAHLADRTVDSLSGGERARAQFARILAGESDWILADEPLASLDPPHQRDVLTLLRAAAHAGKGVIVVLHQLMAAAQVADDVAILREGTLLGFGSQDEVMSATMLSDAFGMDMDVVRLDDRTAIFPL